LSFLIKLTKSWSMMIKHRVLSRECNIIGVLLALTYER